VHAELPEAGVRAGRKRLARLMRGLGLQGVSRRKGRRSTLRGRDRQPAAALVQRDFTAQRPNQLWVADITYIPTWAGFYYLAVALDAFSRRGIGGSMATHLRTERVLHALEIALMQRGPKEAIYPSDQGCQYTSIAFGQCCKTAGVRPPMGSAGDCYDNAMAESFFATLECELLDRIRFRTLAEARIAVFEFIDTWYKPRRRHSALEYRFPIQYEKMHQRTLEPRKR
jgi:putative transposase